MPSSNLTTEFRKAVNEKQSQLPEVKRRTTTTVSSPKLPTAGRDGRVGIGKEYLAEAYTILNHITTLTRMLGGVRKAYLNVDSRDAWVSSSRASSSSSQTLDLNRGDDVSWADIRHLTNEEREQIDLQARVILTRCADRVREMEALEKPWKADFGRRPVTGRVGVVASQSNPLSRLLPSRLLTTAGATLASDFLAAHHAGVTWYLGRRLAEASQAQKEMQEERVRRQLERTRSLGSTAAREVSLMGKSVTVVSQQQGRESSMVGSWLGDASLGLFGAATGMGPSRDMLTAPPTPLDEEDDEELELSASQILQFEQENAQILRTVQDTLESVQQAEQRLTDISMLQMELVSHLTRQTELTDQLYEDAIATTSAVEKGNKELKETKRRAKDSRVFILVFLIGASLSVLFLHYY